MNEDDSPERGRSFADAARHIAYVQGARGHDGPSRQRVRTRRLPLQGKRARVGMHLEGVEVHRRELVAQKSEPMMKQGPGERRFPSAGLRDEHHRRSTREHRSMHEVEVAAELLQLDSDVCVEQREERAVVLRRERCSSLPRDVERRGRAVPADGIVEIHRASVALHLTIGSGHEGLRRGLSAAHANASSQDSESKEVLDCPASMRG